MKNWQMRDVAEAVLYSMTESEFANCLRQQGVHTIYHQGRYWRETAFGFYEPIHWLARLTVQQATRPTLLCWGYRSSLCEQDKVAATGLIPIQLLTNVQSYDFQSLAGNRRNRLRKCYKQAQIIQLMAPSLLQTQGYEVLTSSIERTAYGKLPTKAEYLASLKAYFSYKSGLILAGLVNDQLGGYVFGYAVNRTAYIQEVRVSTEAYSSCVGLGLVFEFAQACRRGNIQEIVYGLHSREDPALCLFKEEMGFPAKYIPSKVEINFPLNNFIKWYAPHKYYRLTGYDK